MEGGVIMFWLGLGIGLVVGSMVGFFVLALCKMTDVADRYADNLYRITYRGDNNGNNQGL